MQVKQNKEYELNDKDCLWRYTDLHQLLYFLNTESIFFAPLSSFDDPLEGISEKHLMGDPQHSPGTIDPLNNDKLQQAQQYIFASCWFLGDTESMAMWETHSNPDSVAIEFNAKKLAELIIDKAKEFQSRDFTTLCHGKVDYIRLSPVDEECLRQYNHQFIGFLKDKSYKHEEEFRFIVVQSERPDKTYRGFDLPAGALKDLDFHIITHPKMENWKHENLEQVLKNFSLQDKLKRSSVLTKNKL